MGQHTGVLPRSKQTRPQNPASSSPTFHATSPRGRDRFGAIFGVYEMAVVSDLIISRDVHDQVIDLTYPDAPLL